MGITYYNQERVLKLDTRSASYLIGIVDEENFVGHIYFGKKIDDFDLQYLLRIKEAPFVPSKNNGDRLSFYDSFPWEFPTHGIGDFREACMAVETNLGHSAVKLGYVSHKIYKGKPKLKGLPATFGSEEECTTLELLCIDDALEFEVTLIYTVFEDIDAVVRSALIKNAGDKVCYLTKALSLCLDMDDKAFDMISLHGSWGRERHIQRQAVGYGKKVISSLRGEPGHQDHPFFALAGKNSTQDTGEVYGFHFVYSGNFMAGVEKNQFDNIRAIMGINPCDFKWKMEKDSYFQTPEAVLVYSCDGIGGMTRQFHDLYRKHLIRSIYKDKKRPVLMNNWEATYFEFDTDKLLSIAKEAAKAGMEMLVMDDGWFGNRNSDDCALGDWTVNEKKIKGGLKYLADEVNKLGLKFGIWFEPEMISPDSDLYRRHPEWAIAITGRTAGLARNQYVLDITRKEVRDYVYEQISSILKSADIEYVKWDMNRPLCDMGSGALPADRQGEMYHRYVLGLYELQERLINDFPYLLLENCSGGGARFDPGMLYYSPQIWCSDDTDAIERLVIQEGTAMVYPLSVMGAHVSDCPNHSAGRITPFETRGYVAMAGTFGYELDITKISEEEKQMIPEQIALYHKYHDLIRTGDYYRIASYSENHAFDCWQIVSKDKGESLITYVQVLNRANCRSRQICLKGLSPDKKYKLSTSEKVYFGSTLMYAGILINNPWGDFKGGLIHITESIS